MKKPQKAQKAQKSKKFLCLLCLLCLLPSLLLAAGPVLVGRVLDSHGKGISDATVRVQTEDGRTVDVVTDNHGAFRIEVSGKTRIEIRHDGYRTVRSAPMSISGVSADIYQVDIPLLAGNPKEVETVQLQIEEVANPETRADPNAREGLPKSDRLFGLRGGVNVGAIHEGTGQQWFGTSDFSAELGDTTTGNDALPAGGTEFHGNVHYFHRDDVFNAKNFFDPVGQPIPPFKYDFFGGDSGGRIRDGDYFYSQYWGLRIQQSISRAAIVPDPVWLTGNFSSVADPIIDPETGFPFDRNRVPASRISPQGLALARLYPAPNVFDGSIQNYRAVGKLDTAADAFGFRFDHRLTPADETFVEYQVIAMRCRRKR